MVPGLGVIVVMPCAVSFICCYRAISNLLNELCMEYNATRVVTVGLKTAYKSKIVLSDNISLNALSHDSNYIPPSSQTLPSKTDYPTVMRGGIGFWPAINSV